VPIAGGFQLSVTAVPLIVLAVKRSVPLIFGFCTGEISGWTVAVGTEVVWLLVKLMLWVVPPGTGTATEALWQTRKVRLQAGGNGSLYCTVPASTSVVNGGFVDVVNGGFVDKGGNVATVEFVGQEEDVRKAEKFWPVHIRSMGTGGFVGETFGPSEAIKGCTESEKLPAKAAGAVGAM
jgi:hypothetical protein